MWVSIDPSSWSIVISEADGGDAEGGGQAPVTSAQANGHAWRWELSLIEMNGSNSPWPVFQRTSAEHISVAKNSYSQDPVYFSCPRISSILILCYCVYKCSGPREDAYLYQGPSARQPRVPQVFWREMVPLSLWEINYNQSKNCGLFKWEIPGFVLTFLCPLCSVCPSTHVTVGLVQLVVSDQIRFAFTTSRYISRLSS